MKETAVVVFADGAEMIQKTVSGQPDQGEHMRYAGKPDQTKWVRERISESNEQIERIERKEETW